MADANPVEVQPGTTLLLACLEDTDRAALEEALGREFRLLFAKSACEALGTMRAQDPRPFSSTPSRPMPTPFSASSTATWGGKTPACSPLHQDTTRISR